MCAKSTVISQGRETKVEQVALISFISIGLILSIRGGRKRSISATYKYSVNCIFYLEFHVSPNSCNTKLANGGDDLGLLDIQIVLRVSIKLMSFFRQTPYFSR